MSSGFKPQGANNPGQATFWQLAMSGDAAREFNYLWHQYGRLENIWAALQDWKAASAEDRFNVNQKLVSFNPMMLDALWTTLLVGLAAFGDKQNHNGTEPLGIPAWLERHRMVFPKGSGTVCLQVQVDLETALRGIKKLRNTRLAHWDREHVAKDHLAVHANEVIMAFGQIEHSVRLIEACFAKDHLMQLPPMNHFGGMRTYIRLVAESPLGPKDLF
jgi:hypothetical protein